MYCTVCGQYLNEKTHTCPNCGFDPSRGEDYCGICGSRLGALGDCPNCDKYEDNVEDDPINESYDTEDDYVEIACCNACGSESITYIKGGLNFRGARTKLTPLVVILIIQIILLSLGLGIIAAIASIFEIMAAAAVIEELVKNSGRVFKICGNCGHCTILVEDLDRINVPYDR